MHLPHLRDASPNPSHPFWPKAKAWRTARPRQLMAAIDRLYPLSYVRSRYLHASYARGYVVGVAVATTRILTFDRVFGLGKSGP
eukprot:scaffold63958_cov35-Tisochrysis_lutea.AAC.1